jgi:predicted  nucleic acid-binding Zn-ribbon protein
LENRLRLLFNLQKVDSEFDDLQDLKGDLPGLVRKLEEQVAGQESLKKELEETVKRSFAARDAADTEILDLKEKIEKYKTQQFEVKSNKQYDALGREIDYSQERITKLTKEMELVETEAIKSKEDAEKLNPEIEQLKKELSEKAEELALVNQEHEEEELKLTHQREKIVARVQKGDLQMYERIRKAKDGLAVVAVKRNSCGGCYNRIPPQRVLELRKNSKITTCERCGRILVSDEMASSGTDVV